MPTSLRVTKLFRGPLEGQGKQQFQARCARFRFAEGQLLRVVIGRGMVRAHGVDGAIAQPRAQSRAITQGAQGRNEARMRVEITDVGVAQVGVMDGHVTGHRKPLLLRQANQVDPLSGRQAA